MSARIYDIVAGNKLHKKWYVVSGVIHWGMGAIWLGYAIFYLCRHRLSIWRRRDR